MKIHYLKNFFNLEFSQKMLKTDEKRSKKRWKRQNMLTSKHVCMCD